MTFPCQLPSCGGQRGAQLQRVLRARSWEGVLEELLPNLLSNTNQGEGAIELFKKAIEHVKSLAFDDG